MSKKIIINGKLEFQENKKETKELSAKGTFEEVKGKEEFVPKTLWVLFLGIHILLIICAIIFSKISIGVKETKIFYLTSRHYLFLVLTICITTIILNIVIFFCINNNNKLRLINKILDDSNIEKISDTTSNYDKEGNIEKLHLPTNKQKFLSRSS